MIEEKVGDFPRLFFGKETGSVSSNHVKQALLKHTFTQPNFLPLQEISVKAIVNYIDIDATHKFVVTSDNGGWARIFEFEDLSRGRLKLLDKKKYLSSTLLKTQWYPSDNGMLCMTYPEKVLVVDTNTLKPIDSFDFGPKKKIYGTDWNSLNPCLIGVAISSSTLGFIDIRTGSSLQQITVESLLGAPNHNVTRVLWSKLDDECIIAGDSSGYIHIFDIRKPRKSLQTVGSDSLTCKPVVYLGFTCDNANLISSHGLTTHLTQWTFRKRRLVNTNINYPSPVPRISTKNRLKMRLEYQLYVTDNLIFKPASSVNVSQLGELVIHDLKNGERLGFLNPPTWTPDNCANINCVNGVFTDYPILLTGSKKLLMVWGCNNSDNTSDGKHELHRDDWSD